MSEEIEKKSGITFEYKRAEEMTTIIATANNHELPKVFTRLKCSAFGVWAIEVSLKPTYDKYDYGYVFYGCCFRGRSFAERIARFAILGCFSSLGKRRRLMSNKQKKAEVKHGRLSALPALSV